jgi:hypothetical protein
MVGDREERELRSHWLSDVRRTRGLGEDGKPLRLARRERDEIRGLGEGDIARSNPVMPKPL